MCVRDNLEFWLKYKFSRVVNGEMLTSRVIHTVTGANVPVPSRIIPAPPPTWADVCSRPHNNPWPFVGKFDVAKDAILSRESVERFFSKVWVGALEKVRAKKSGLFTRPPPEEDQAHPRPPTRWHTSPLLYEVGTASYADTVKIYENVRTSSNALFHVGFGDMQTAQRMWWQKFRYPHLMRGGIFIPADLHGEIHQEDAIWQHGYSFVINAFELHLGVKGLGPKLYMKNHNTRAHWLHVFVSAGLQWLLELGIPDAVLLEPVKLLHHVRYNLPAWDFIGWLLYCGLAGYEWKRAVRCSDSKALNYLWQYSIVLYGPTRKNTYKMGALRHVKIHKDSEPNVQAIMNKFRTFSRSGEPSKGEGWDDLNEQVAHAAPLFHLTHAHVWHVHTPTTTPTPGGKVTEGGKSGGK